MINRTSFNAAGALALTIGGLLLLVISGCSLLQRVPSVNVPVIPAPTKTSSTQSFTPGSLPPIAEVAAKVRPAVVLVATQDVSLDFFLQPIQEQGSGSGVIFDARGYILTNSHVVRGARSIRIILPDGRTFTNVTVVGRDTATDLAVLKIEGNDLPTAQFGDSSALRIGDWVIAIGNALGLQGGPTVTAGVVGATGRSIREPNGGPTLDDLIQTDAAINPGNSGGPLVNLDGQIIGINTAIASGGQGIGFAINTNSARPIINELIQRGKVVRAYIGVTAATLTAAVANQLGITPREGVAIVTAPRSGPAAMAGLRVGDVITAIDGKTLSNVESLVTTIREHKPGDRVNVSYVRGGAEQNVAVTLGELPSD